MKRQVAVLVVAALAVGSASFAHDHDAVRVDALIGLARTLRDAGRTAEAADTFRAARAARPLDADLRQEAFWVEVEVDAPAGIALGVEILRSAPSMHPVRARAIAAAAAAGQDEVATRLAREGAALAPQDPRWPRHEGESALRRGDAPAAVAAFQRAHHLGGHDADLAMLAIALEASENQAEAWRTWSRVPAAVVVDADASWRDSRLRATIAAAPLEAAERAVAARCVGGAGPAAASAAAPGSSPPCPIPNDLAHASWWSVLAERAARDRQPRRALAALGPLLDGPHRLFFLRRASDLAAAAGDLDTASAHLDAFVASGGGTESDRWRLVEVAALRGNGSEVIAAATRGGLSPCDERVMRALEQTSDALRLADATLTRPTSCPGWIEWRVRAAHAVLSHQDMRGASDLLTPVETAPACVAPVGMGPDCLDALELLGRVRAWSKDYAGAIAALQRVTAAAPARVEALDALIEAHRALGDRAAAWRAVQQRRPLAPATPALHLTWARVALEADEPAEAAAMASAMDAASVGRERDSVLLLAAAARRQDEDAVRLCHALAPLVDEESAACSAAALRFATARRAAGDLRGALAVLRGVPAPDADTAALRASLAAAVDGREAGLREFAALIQRPDAKAGAFLAMAELQPSPSPRLSTLEEGHRRLPADLDIGEALSTALLQNRAHAAAYDVARAVVASDGRRVLAWTTAVEAASTVAPEDVPALLAAMETSLASDGRLLAEAATNLGWLALAPGDPITTSTLRWLDRAIADTPDAAPRLARARVLAATRDWPAALADLDAVVAAAPEHAEALRFRAEVLSYAGRYAESLAAYDRYVQQRPEDVAARRQQARVAGWGQDFEEMRRRYRALVAEQPGHSVVRAEFDAKAAFALGDWDAAILAYRRWLELEPGDREAAFELAQAEAQRGALLQASQSFARIAAWTPVHREAEIARARFESARRPSVRPYSNWQSSDGYDGQRVLEVADSGLAGRWTLGQAEAVDLTVGGGALEAAADDQRWRGTQWSAGVLLRPDRAWRLSAQLGATDLAARTTATFDVATRWQPSGPWTVRFGTSRVRWLENAATTSLGLHTTRIDAAAQWRGLDTSIDLTTSRRAISDGNHAWSAASFLRRRVRRGRDEVALIAWAEWQGFERRADVYFSPLGFLRADAGVEWRGALMRPRFADDLARHVTAAYLVGVDERGVLYHHPSVTGSWEVHDGLALEAVGDWLRSAVFTQTRVSLRVRVGGAGRR